MPTSPGRRWRYERSRADLAQRADAAELAALGELRQARRGARGRDQAVHRAHERGAPRDGIVIYCANRDGVKKKVGDSTWRAEKVLETDDVTVMMARGRGRRGRLEPRAVGQRVTLRLDAHPDAEFARPRRRRSRKIVQRQSSKNPLKVMQLEIAFDKTEPHIMLPGMRFRGTVETGRVHDARRRAGDAIFVTESGPIVWRKTATGFERRTVEVGQRNKDLVEIRVGPRRGRPGLAYRSRRTRRRARPGASS